MSIEETLLALSKRIPETADPDEAITNSDTPVIKISGLLNKVHEDSLTIAMGGAEIGIRKADLLHIEESESRPAGSIEWPFVTVSVLASVNLRETRIRTAGSLGKHIGRRPFVYELPSTASQYAISHQEFEERERLWRQKVGIAFRPFDSTVYFTTSNTPKTSTYDTFTSTSTPNDTQQDYHGEDSKSDDQQDTVEDLKDDGDGVLT